MSIVAHSYPFVVGVDTHARNHVYAIINCSNGALLDTQAFPASSAGINRAITWVARRTEGNADILWVIEGAATYGAILAGTVAAHGFPVSEAPRMNKKQHRGVGKNDALDAHRMAIAIARAEAVRLARHILELKQQLSANEKRLDELVRGSEAAPLLEETGFKAITAAKCFLAWSHQGRVRDEAAFASLAGVNPIPASSGNTTRHRLNRGGDRTLNAALHMAAVTRMTYHAETREYIE